MGLLLCCVRALTCVATRRQKMEKAVKDMPRMIEQVQKAAREERKKAREKGAWLLKNLPLVPKSKKYEQFLIVQRRKQKEEAKLKKKAEADAATTTTPTTTLPTTTPPITTKL